MNYVIAVILLRVSYMNTHKTLLYFARFCAESTPKMANKKIIQRTLAGLLTMSVGTGCFIHDMERFCVVTNCVTLQWHESNTNSMTNEKQYKPLSKLGWSNLISLHDLAGCSLVPFWSLKLLIFLSTSLDAKSISSLWASKTWKMLDIKLTAFPCTKNWYLFYFCIAVIFHHWIIACSR